MPDPYAKNRNFWSHFYHFKIWTLFLYIVILLLFCHFDKKEEGFQTGSKISVQWKDIYTWGGKISIQRKDIYTGGGKISIQWKEIFPGGGKISIQWKEIYPGGGKISIRW